MRKSPVAWLLLVLALAACSQPPDQTTRVEPTATRRPNQPALGVTLPATWTPAPTVTPQPWRSLTPRATSIQASATAGPSLGSAYLSGVAPLLPEGSRPLAERSWQIPARPGWSSLWLLPFETAEGPSTGLDVALVGLPLSPGGGWDRKTLILLWTGQAEHPGEALWEEVQALPLASLASPGSADGFLGRRAGGEWQLIALEIGETAVSSLLLPVSGAEEVFLVRAPLKPGGQLHYFVRDGSGAGRLTVYDRAGQPVGRANQAPGRTFTVTSDLPSIAVDGSGTSLLLVTWTGEGGRALQLFALVNNRLALVAEPALDDQLLEVDGDGYRELVASSGQVRRWTGQGFGEAAAPRVSSAPEPAPLSAWTSLPRLPADLYLRGGDGQWTVWSAAGGALAQAEKAPLPRPCTSPSEPCLSPDGRFELIAVVEVLPTPTPTVTPTSAPSATPEPGASILQPSPSVTVTAQATPTAGPQRVRVRAGVRSTGSGRVVTIQGTLTEEGQNTFAWSEDGRLLLARAGVSGGLFWVEPSTGETTPLLELARCSLANPPCPQVSTGMGASDPLFFAGGDIGFAVQSTTAGQYPAPGVYRLSSDGQLNLLANLSTLDPMCVVTQSGYGFGQVVWAADGSAFVYYDPPNCPGARVLLGLGDGSALWDLSGLPGTVTALRFGERIP